MSPLPTIENERRSRTMRAVKGADTAPELTVRRLAHRLGYRFRLHRRDLPGCPDLVFPARRKVVFVHGCFWHGHDCRRGARTPSANRDYWVNKIARNVERDSRSVGRLTQMGWSALTLWECQLRDLVALERRLQTFLP